MEKVDNPYLPVADCDDHSVVEMEVVDVGSEPVGVRCPYCRHDIMTTARYQNSRTTHLAAVLLGLVGWCFCCCILPYTTKKFKDVEHYCSRCDRYLGLHKRQSIIPLTLSGWKT